MSAARYQLRRRVIESIVLQATRDGAPETLLDAIRAVECVARGPVARRVETGLTRIALTFGLVPDWTIGPWQVRARSILASEAIASTSVGLGLVRVDRRLGAALFDEAAQRRAAARLLPDTGDGGTMIRNYRAALLYQSGRVRGRSIYAAAVCACLSGVWMTHLAANRR